MKKALALLALISSVVSHDPRLKQFLISDFPSPRFFVVIVVGGVSISVTTARIITLGFSNPRDVVGPFFFMDSGSHLLLLHNSYCVREKEREREKTTL